ncbi:MAG: SIMPL domain-containing protein [Silicimonas sp.]|nr:SIMPL domain-containing protein [Silicimonas sp.]
MRISAFVFSVALLFPLHAIAQDTPGQIVVTGIGYASAPPDKAVIRIEVSHTARRTDVAMKNLASNVEKVLTTARTHGVADDDIETTRFSLTEDWNYDGDTRKFDGYKASTRLTMDIRELSVLGNFITTISSGTGIEITGPEFALENDRALRDEARRKAVLDGVATARLLAEAAGVTLGPPVLITDGTETPGGLDGSVQFEEAMEEEVIMEEPSVEIAENAISVIPADIETVQITKLVFRIEK